MSAFPPDAERTLACVLDEIIPPDGGRGLPGAGELGLTAHVEASLERLPALRPGVVEGLATLDALAREGGAAGFASVPQPERRAVLEAHAETAPAFLGPLVMLTFAGYYAEPRVLEALGHDARPPFPLGFEVPPSDLSLLDPVRERGPIFREA